MSDNIKSVLLSQNSSNNISTTNNEINVVLPSVWYADNYSVSLANLYIYYSWFNITSKINNNSFSYIWTDGSTVNITMPDGLYTASDISSYIQFIMKQNGHFLYDNSVPAQEVYYMTLNENTIYYAITFTSSPIPSGALPAGWSYGTNAGDFGALNGQGPQLVVPAVSASTFNSIIGFNPGTYPPATQTSLYSINSQFVPQVSPVTAVNVVCNLCDSGSFNEVSNIIATFSSGDTQFGGQIKVVNPYPIYFNVADGRYSTIKLSLLQDDGQPLNVVDSNWQATLNLRKNPPQPLMRQ